MRPPRTKLVLELHWWQRKESIIAFAIIGALMLIAVLILVSHIFHWDLTTTTTTEVTQSTKKKVTTIETGKTLLDWLQLLGVIAIPIVVGFGTAYFTRQQARISEANSNRQHDIELEITGDRRQDEHLRTYLDKVSDLLLNKDLSSEPTVQFIVRARTLAVLHILKDADRKTIVLRFLHDTDLLQYVKGFLYGLNLSYTNLTSIDLSGAALLGANLSSANLTNANLSGAFLLDSCLRDASLVGADLSGAKLITADLRGANLVGTNLKSADLRGADLRGAILGEGDLASYLKIDELSGTFLSEMDLSEIHLRSTDLSDADLRGAIATPEQFIEAKNVTQEQLAQIKSPKPIVPQGVKKTEQVPTTQTQSETKPDQTSQEEAEQQEEHQQSKQDTETAH